MPDANHAYPGFAPELRTLAHVPRWSVLRRIRTQSVAEHSYFVAVYALEIARFVKYVGDASSLLRYALWHDAAEYATGDIVGPYKRHIRAASTPAEHAIVQKAFGDSIEAVIFHPSVQERVIVKVANKTDELYYLMDEAHLGNEFVRHAVFQVVAHLDRACKELYRALGQEYDLGLFRLINNRACVFPRFPDDSTGVFNTEPS